MAGQGVSPSAPAMPRVTASLPLAALPDAPRMARAHVQAVLADWRLSEFTDVAKLITSELVSNAVAASAHALGGEWASAICVCLVTDGDVLAVEVRDHAPGVPVLREADWLAENGRGLAIVDALTGGAWGCQPAIGQRGKCVWAAIRVRDESSPVPGLSMDSR
jgi:anti-sigma regulatory factor (Ser/Thr protein kinase)